MTARDFLGREILPGSYVVKGGAGNSAAEYGMILYRVTKVSPDKIGAVRLKARCDAPFTDASWVIKVSKVTLTTSLALLVCDPPEDTVAIFEEAVADPAGLTPKERCQIAYWLHGTKRLH